MKTKFNWIAEGLLFGIVMFVFSSILDLITDDFSLDGIWKRILIWIIGGLIFGLTMKFLRNRKNTK